MHVRWTHDGNVRQEIYSIDASHYTFVDLTADANTPVVITNVSPVGAHANGRLRVAYIEVGVHP